MREIRSRISQRHGIELTTQQIQELAARRLEAILDPRTVKPSLLEQIRRSTTTPVDAPQAAEPSYEFEGTTLYDTHRGALRFIRRLLNPLLKLFFNPNPMIEALSTQARLNKAAIHREAERDRRQAEWNSLHYEILQRLVLEISRTSLESQQLSMRVEALSAKVEFAERRARSLEGALHQTRPAPRQEERTPPVPQAAQQTREPGTTEAPTAPTGAEGVAGEGGRRRRRRRRGRRPQPFTPEGAAIGAAAGAALPESVLGAEGIDSDADEPDDEGEADVSGDVGDSTSPYAPPVSTVETVETAPVPTEQTPPDVAVAEVVPPAESRPTPTESGPTSQADSVTSDPDQPPPSGLVGD